MLFYPCQYIKKAPLFEI